MCFIFRSSCERERAKVRDLAVCANCSSHFVAKLFQKMLGESGFDEARSDCVEFSFAGTRRRGRLDPSPRGDHCAVSTQHVLGTASQETLGFVEIVTHE